MSDSEHVASPSIHHSALSDSDDLEVPAEASEAIEGSADEDVSFGGGGGASTRLHPWR